YGDSGQLIAQFIGPAANRVFVFPASWLFFKALDALIGMRVSPEAEIEGLDHHEVAPPAYPETLLPAPALAPVPVTGASDSDARRCDRAPAGAPPNQDARARRRRCCGRVPGECRIPARSRPGRPAHGESGRPRGSCTGSCLWRTGYPGGCGTSPHRPAGGPP